MKCPKCNYTSFDYLSECKKCGEALDESRLALNFKTTSPIPFTEEPTRPPETTPTVTAASKDSAGREKQAPPSEMPGLETFPGGPVPVRNDSATGDDEISLSRLGQLGKRDKKDEPAGLSDFETLPEIDFGRELEPDDKEASAANGFGKIELGHEFVKTDKDQLSAPEDRDQEPGLFSDLDLSPETRETSKKKLPFSFSDNENEEINLKISDEEEGQSEADCIELELDMDDDESIDQILADLEKK